MKQSAITYLLSCFLVLSPLFILLPLPSLADNHGISLYGGLKYKKSFPHFDYVNPAAPKGGEVRLGAIGGFDNLNPFALKGRLGTGLGLIYDSLTVGSSDDPHAQYGLLAEKIILTKDRRKISFILKAHARWHDGTPILPEDVIFSYEAATGPKGPPLYQQYYADIARIEKTGPRQVTFHLKNPDNAELPLTIGQLPILPARFWKQHDITKTLLIAPLGSGPYRIERLEANRFIRYVRVKDYWGKDEAVSKGFYNFEVLRYDYYRDTNVLVEAVKAGDIDFRAENSSKSWATAYNIPALDRGELIKKTFPDDRVIGMQGYVFNQRRPVFKDRAVRKALAHGFDFEWANRALFYGQYKRSRSYFANSEFEAKKLPAGKTRAILKKWQKDIPAEVFTDIYTPPSTGGTHGGLRENLRKADAILKKAGWIIKDGKRVRAKDNLPLTFELMLFDPLQERIALPFIQNLKKLGIQGRIRTVDAAQYVARIDQFDYDMIVTSWGQSERPGNEQRDMWTSRAAGLAGSANYGGVENKAVDALVEDIIRARTLPDLHDRVRALDAILQWTHLVVPHFHADYNRILYWNKFGLPKGQSREGVNFNSWWFDPALPLNRPASP